MKIYAVIHKDKVINRIIWSGEGNWKYPFPHDELIEDNEGFYNIGMYFEEGQWHQPIPSEPTELELLLD